VRQADGVYDTTFEEIDQSDLTGYTDENVLELTRRHAAILEKYIRLYPDQWLWMHKRWKHTEQYEAHSTILQES
jgi:KDO2-lipid IV(A) lauroyltransferase